MIEDKKLGLKIAEDPIEAAWQRVKDNSKQKVIELKIAVEIEEAVSKLAESKLKK